MNGWMEGWHLFPCAVYRLTLKDWQISGVGVTGRQHHWFFCSSCFSEHTALHHHHPFTIHTALTFKAVSIIYGH